MVICYDDGRLVICETISLRLEDVDLEITYNYDDMKLKPDAQISFNGGRTIVFDPHDPRAVLSCIQECFTVGPEAAEAAVRLILGFTSHKFDDEKEFIQSGADTVSKMLEMGHSEEKVVKFLREGMISFHVELIDKIMARAKG